MDDSKVISKGRLGPGMMIAVDLETGEVSQVRCILKVALDVDEGCQWNHFYL